MTCVNSSEIGGDSSDAVEIAKQLAEMNSNSMLITNVLKKDFKLKKVFRSKNRSQT
jgi:hypothetical protein